MATSERSSILNDAAAGKNGSAIGDTGLQGLRDDVAHLAQQIATLLVAATEGTLDEMKGQIPRARQKIDDLMTDARETGKDAVDAAREATDPLVKGVEEAVQNHPFVALGLAVGIGLAFGAMLRR